MHSIPFPELPTDNFYFSPVLPTSTHTKQKYQRYNHIKFQTQFKCYKILDILQSLYILPKSDYYLPSWLVRKSKSVLLMRLLLDVFGVKEAEHENWDSRFLYLFPGHRSLIR